MKEVYKQKLIEDLDSNHEQWRQQGDRLERKLGSKGDNSSTTVTLEENGTMKVEMSGANYAVHRIRPGFFQRRRIKLAAEEAKERILAQSLSSLGK